MVATKNGGYVDIHRVLDNVFLIDPHNQQSIANALLKLVADRNLWLRCRENGLENIHLNSWPEHCNTYLARILSYKQRHPQWQGGDELYTNSDSDSPGESQRDIHDLSLKLSLDGNKEEVGGGADKGLESGKEASMKKGHVENSAMALSGTAAMEKAEQITLDRQLLDALDIVPENLPVTLCATFFLTFAAFSSAIIFTRNIGCDHV